MHTRRATVGYLLILAVILLQPFGLGSSGGTESAVLWFPTAETAGEVVNRGLLIAWDSDPEREISHAEFAVLLDGEWVRIEPSGSGTPDMMSDTWSIFWDTTDLPAGDYEVRVTLVSADGRASVAQRRIPVAKAPVVNAHVSFDGAQVVFFGCPSYDPDGEIERYDWDFGDGSTATGQVESHVYEDPAETYYPMLTVTDDDGYETTGYYHIIPESNVFFPAPSCGCQTMSVKIDGISGMPLWWMPATQSRSLGAVNPIPNPLPNPPGGPYYLRYNFEVEAQLVPGSDPTKCTEWQKAKRTAHDDNSTDHKTVAGVQYPFAGAVLGPDDYTGPAAGIKEHVGLTVRWVDGPGYGIPILNRGGLPGTDVATSAPQGVTWDAAFEGEVKGDLGTCNCTWLLTWAIANTGAVQTPPTVLNTRCTCK